MRILIAGLCLLVAGCGLMNKFDRSAPTPAYQTGSRKISPARGIPEMGLFGVRRFVAALILSSAQLNSPSWTLQKAAMNRRTPKLPITVVGRFADRAS